MSKSLDGIFRPSSIAIIGASSREGTIGHSILHNLIGFNFNGKVFPVNPRANFIHSIKCYSTILDVPDAVDLAIIVVPAEHVKGVLEQCGEKGCRGVVVITSGFKEVGEDGVRMEQELLEIVQKYEMRMIGPNCFGVLNTDSEYSMNSTFSKAQPLKGNVAFMSQSGALGEAILGLANELNLGFSQFASVGNKADISGNDILQYWGDDPNTDIILMYLESFGNPREFTRIARGLARQKPIVAVKAGRTAAGARAISSHTGVLAGLDVGVTALFEQCGVYRVTSMDEMFDIAMALSNQPLPKGDRIAVITNAGGPGILATDAIVSLGMKMAKFEKKTTKVLRDKLPAVASVNNPVDVIAAGGPDSYRIAMDVVLADKNVDAVICIFVPPVVVDHRAVIDAIVKSIDKHNNDKPVLGCLMATPSEIAGSEEMVTRRIPIYTFPESAAKAMAAMVRRTRWLKRPQGRVVTFKDVDRDRVNQIIDRAIKEKRETIMGADALEILDAYGVNIARAVHCENVKEVQAAASQLQLPVIMKIDAPEIVHKTDVGGVSDNLRTEADVKKAFEAMKRKFGKEGTPGGVIVQELVPNGVETIIGMFQDPSFGPLLMFGLGGIYVEVMKDVTFKIHPVTTHGAKEMIESVKGYPLLNGFRGAPAVDFKCLQETIQRLSQLVTDFPQLESFDVNPFFAAPDRKNSKAVDARFMLKKE